MQKLIEACRENFGAAPRKFGIADRPYLRTMPPSWTQRDALGAVYKNQGKILRDGQIVWAHIVQANRRMFNMLPEDLPAAIVYTLDPRGDNEPEILKDAAMRVHELKGTTPEESSLLGIANLITNETSRPLKEPLPSSMGFDRAIVLSSIMVLRKHLPFGFLSCRMFPLLVAPGVTDWTMILPSRYWPTELIDR